MDANECAQIFIAGEIKQKTSIRKSKVMFMATNKRAVIFFSCCSKPQEVYEKMLFILDSCHTTEWFVVSFSYFLPKDTYVMNTNTQDKKVHVTSVHFGWRYGASCYYFLQMPATLISDHNDQSYSHVLRWIVNCTCCLGFLFFVLSCLGGAHSFNHHPIKVKTNSGHINLALSEGRVL